MSAKLEGKAINGSKKAIKKLVQRDSEFIYILAYLHTKYEEDAKTILKNTVVFINKSIGKSVNYNKYEDYLMKVTIKHIKEYLNEFGMVDNKINSLYKEDNKVKVDLYKAIDMLDTDLKSAVILRYFYNKGYEDIGNILEVNESTVKMYIRKSLKIMKSETEEDFQYEREAK